MSVIRSATLYYKSEFTGKTRYKNNKLQQTLESAGAYCLGIGLF